MNRLLLRSSLFLLTALYHTASYSQNFTATYTFANVTTTSGPIDPTPVPAATGITFGSFRVVGAARTTMSNPNSGGRFNFSGWPISTAINLGEYYEVVVAPQANYGLTLNTLTFTIQRSGTGIKQFSVRSSTDNYGSNLAASFAGTEYTIDANNVFRLVNTSTTVAIANFRVNFNNVNNSLLPDTIRFYGWDAGGTGGTFSLNRAEFAGAATAAAGTPLLTLDTNNIRFPSLQPNSTSPGLQYTVKGVDLSNPVTVTTAAPFAVSDAANGPYSTSLTLASVDVATPKIVYVQFTPVSVGTFGGTISNSSPGAASLSVTLTGQGIDPANLSFNFNNCTAQGQPGGGFIPYSIAGPQGFTCSQFGYSSTNGLDINGYSGGAVDNEDWLISPPLSISSLTTPILSFFSRGEFSGPSLQLLVSTDYDGYSSPANATWTDLEAAFPPLTNTWTLTDGINLSFYKSASKLYIAFKYTSSTELGAARWSLDNVIVSDRSKLVATNSTTLNFGELASGNSSAGQAFTLLGFGYGNITVSAPAGFQVSADNTTYTTTVQFDSAAVQSGAIVYARFSPASKLLKVEGKIRFSGTGLDSSIVSLTGSSYPKAETFDVGAYNLSFFGSNPTNNPTPQKITTQINNISTIFQRLNLDIVGVSEVSSDSAMAVLTSTLPGYAYVLSNRWSYSFDPPDPNFPAQKIGFVYNTATTQLVDQRVLFESLFDSLRNGQATLPGYPGGTPARFWASGRLPYMATFDVTIGGISKRVRIIVIHAKSASDADSYNRRVYDIRLLKDSLDAYYKDDNIILVGDYNDRVYGSIFAGGVSPYGIFVNDTSNYNALTYPLDSAGRVSFISGTGLIDHLISSNELKRNYIANSTEIEDPRSYISGYNATTASDHLPIYSRLTLTDQALPVKLIQFYAESHKSTVVLAWRTAQETNNNYFEVERSTDGRNFYTIARVPGAGTTTTPRNYQSVDSFPVTGVNYYRLRQVDADGKATVSYIVTVNMAGTGSKLLLYPNPVTHYFQLSGPATITAYTALVSSADGRLMFQTRGTISAINRFVNQQLGKLKAGMYILRLKSADTQQNFPFIRQ